MSGRPATKSVLLAAGLGTRLRPLTNRTPKCLLPIAGRPILDYWIDALGDAAVREILLNTHALREQVSSYIEAVNRRGCQMLVESYEPELLGSAGTIAANRHFADDVDRVIVIYADNLSDVSLTDLLDYHESHPDPITMLLFHASDPRACGIATLGPGNRIVEFIEKPVDPTSDLANAGIYVIDAAMYREIASMNVFDIGFDVLPRLVGRMRGWVWEGTHRDIGTQSAYERAQSEGRRIVRDRGFDADGSRSAVFWDRDGTLIEHVHYLADPTEVVLVPNAARALRQLREAGFASVVVTNQSAIGRGLINEAQLAGIHDEMCRQLAAEGALLDAIYFNPIVPTSDDRTTIDHEDRKPGAGMLQRAAIDLKLRLHDSYMVGDMVSDVVAGANAGCRMNILINANQEFDQSDMPPGVEYTTVPAVSAATRLIMEGGARSRSASEEGDSR